MAEGGKKISFGFSKVLSIKLTKPKVKEEVQYIDCIDSKNIVLFGNDNKKEEATELIIPLKKYESNQKPIAQQNEISTDRDAIATTSNDTTENKTDIGTNESVHSLEAIAVKEILDDVNQSVEVKEEPTSTLILQMQRSRNAEPSKESTIDDYDNIPVSKFGVAMLRGMGWTPGKGIGKNEKIVSAETPQPRPKGMGLGADKVPSTSATSTTVKVNEDLKAVKGAFVCLSSGSRKGHYGQIEGFNEDSGRVIVRLTLQSFTVSVNEGAFRLVTKQEYDKNSRVLNISKYEKFKESSERVQSSDSEGNSTPDSNKRSATTKSHTKKIVAKDSRLQDNESVLERSLSPRNYRRESPSSRGHDKKHGSSSPTTHKFRSPSPAKYKKKQDRSPSPSSSVTHKNRSSSPTKYKKQALKSPSPTTHKYRSPSPVKYKKQHNRSLSPSSPTIRRYRSPSPTKYKKKNYRSPSPSPMTRNKRSPSPSKYKKKQYRSPSPSPMTRKNRSPSPVKYKKQHNRSPSPSSPINRKYRSPSPTKYKKKHYRSPSPSAMTRKKRSPSPGKYKKKQYRSPSPPPMIRKNRSPSPTKYKKKHYRNSLPMSYKSKQYRSPSPGRYKKKYRSRSPVNYKRRHHRSESPD